MHTAFLYFEHIFYFPLDIIVHSFYNIDVWIFSYAVQLWRHNGKCYYESTFQDYPLSKIDP